MAGAVALVQHKVYIAAIDEKALGGATSARPGRPGRLPRERDPRGRRALTRPAREQSSARAQRSSHPFGRGAGSQPVAAAGVQA